MRTFASGGDALAYLRMRQANRESQARSRGEDMTGNRARMHARAPWLPEAMAALRKGRLRALQSRAVRRNPERHRVQGALGQHALRGAGVVTVNDWKTILDAFGHRCGYCGVKDKLMIEHVMPLGDGGKHVAANLIPACGSCNFVKGKRGPLSMVNRHYAMRLA